MRSAETWRRRVPPSERPADVGRPCCSLATTHRERALAKEQETERAERDDDGRGAKPGASTAAAACSPTGAAVREKAEKAQNGASTRPIGYAPATARIGHAGRDCLTKRPRIAAADTTTCGRRRPNPPHRTAAPAAANHPSVHLPRAQGPPRPLATTDSLPTDRPTDDSPLIDRVQPISA